ncbi:MAG: hypothetical protein IT349_13600 [Candidatus Eisenbacteria bacterium]|nr:hypothetical protein [Candidatus Eisenbacteria bacterium]MCC7143129.1 hypothetical protein [Candidatus Eisenbacteria bacterium]
MPRSFLSAWTLPEQPFSHQAWVDQRCREVLARALSPVSAALEPCAVRAIYLGGSASTGEALGRIGPVPVVLSDLDLAFIVDHWPSTALRRAAQHAADTLLEDGDPHLTIGIYPTAALGRQAPTLGWCDLVTAGTILWSRPGTFLPLVAPAPARIPAYEGFRLLGNRALELWSASAERERDHGTDPRSDARFTHALAKALTANWTAWLVFRGAYCVGQRNRLRLIGQVPAPDSVGELARLAGRYFEQPESSGPDFSTLQPYRLALRRVLMESPDLPRERIVLRDQLALRDLWRAWRDHFRLRPGEGGAMRVLGRCMLNGDPIATPELRRLALALRYWAEPDEEWNAYSRRWMGRELPPEAASAERLPALP